MNRTRRLTLSLALNIVLVAVQIVYGVAAHSTGLLADAGHNVTDVAALVLSLVAVRLALRPRSAEHSFGNHRATILAALANAAAITAVTVVIVFESIRRLNQPVHVHAGTVLVVAAVALVVNGLAALVLRDGSHDLNMRSALLHMLGDALASLAVLVSAALLLAYPSATWLDPASALVVAAIIVYEAAIVFRSSVSVLLESTPADVDLADLSAAMRRVEGVEEVHDLHVWSLSSEMRVLSAHLVLSGHPSLEQAQLVGDQVKRTIGGSFSISHSTLELECERCIDSDDDPCPMDSTNSAATERVTVHHH
ncbi:MAG TPA: cation diffusion facilitator family transporter [Acidimicrobiales bacterium]|jgi:cobalt-zinc-cadmium efflux system protein|nr:cation diffusion facilitator family transporter [Acidimicrobiales bacterium]